eukprot:9435956-Pyramimonas_sp.AAC.1
MEGVALLPARAKRDKALATDEEKSYAEPVISSLCWLSRQQRMGASFGYNWLAQYKNQFTGQHLVEMNKPV